MCGESGSRIQARSRWRDGTCVRLLRHKHFGATDMLGDVAHRFVRIILLLIVFHDVRVVWQSEPDHARGHDSGVEFS